MGLKSDIEKGVDTYFEGTYEVTEGKVIPSVDDIPLGKKGRELEMVMLFADIRESTTIVDGFRRVTAAKMYKSFLWGVTKIARANDGQLLSFNGDGVLAGFVGNSKRTSAGKTALQLAWFCKHVMRPRLKAYFEKNSELEDMEFDMGIGADVGKVLVVRGGIKGENNNDLVWAGNATNYAVKLSALGSAPYYCWISKEVFDEMNESSKLSIGEKKPMWEERTWTAMANQKIYTSCWTWAPND